MTEAHQIQKLREELAELREDNNILRERIAALESLADDLLAAIRTVNNRQHHGGWYETNQRTQ